MPQTVTKPGEAGVLAPPREQLEPGLIYKPYENKYEYFSSPQSTLPQVAAQGRGSAGSSPSHPNSMRQVCVTPSHPAPAASGTTSATPRSQSPQEPLPMGVAGSCTCDIEGKLGVLDQRNEFKIVARERSGTPCRGGGDIFSINMFGPTEVDVSIEDHQNGTYTCAYWPKVEGNYIISIQLGKEHIEGSPWMFSVVMDGEIALGYPRTAKSIKDLSHFIVPRGVCQVSCGSEHSVAVTDHGQVYSWGRPYEGQLGLGGESNFSPLVALPSRVTALEKEVVEEIVCGKNHTLARTNTGYVYAWGQGGEGQLGAGQAVEGNSSLPIRVSALDGYTIKSIFAGPFSSAALTGDGSVFIWGRVVYLGSGKVQIQSIPNAVDGFGAEVIRSLAQGHNHHAAVTESGGLFTWGLGEFGRLGHGVSSDSIYPERVAGFGGQVRIKAVDCGSFHTVAMSEEGILYATGWNPSGQCGFVDKQSLRFVEINLPLPMSGIYCGSKSSAALLDMCEWGVRGTSTAKDIRYVELPIEENDYIISLAMSDDHNLAVCNSRRVLAWGKGDHGKLGFDSLRDIPYAQQIPKLVGLGVGLDWKAIKSSLSSSNPSRVEETFMLLCHLSLNANYKVEIPKAVLVHFILAFIWSKHSDVQVNALLTLANLVDNNEENRREVLDLRVLDSLPALTKSPIPNVQAAALKLMANLLRHNDYSVSEFLETNGLQYILEGLQSADVGDNVQLESVRALSKLANSEAQTWSKKKVTKLLSVSLSGEGHRAQLNFDDDAKLKQQAAVTIQAQLRGQQGRLAAQAQKQQLAQNVARNNAATTIQSHYRGHSTRLKL